MFSICSRRKLYALRLFQKGFNLKAIIYIWSTSFCFVSQVAFKPEGFRTVGLITIFQFRLPLVLPKKYQTLTFKRKLPYNKPLILVTWLPIIVRKSCNLLKTSQTAIKYLRIVNVSLFDTFLTIIVLYEYRINTKFKVTNGLFKSERF